MSKGLKTRKRYRLIFVNDNTLGTVWTLRLSRAKVWGQSALCVAAIAALVVCVVVWSPVSYLLPGYMRPEQRRTTVDNTLRVDSLLASAEEQQRYISNIIELLTESDSAAVAPVPDAPAETGDTLMTSTDNERAFVESWLEKERGNLSVLTPIVAEGMMFRSPTAGATIVAESGELLGSRHAPVVAIQDGMVVDARVDASTGRNSIVVQHDNDFLSVYGGVEQLTVAPGQRVISGQALGRLADDGRLQLSVWHLGRRVDLSSLLPQ